MTVPTADFPSVFREFCAMLRDEHGFRLGVGEIRDALHSLEIIGVHDLETVRSALRLVLCARLEERAVFDAAFQTFFFPASAGASQTALPPTEPPRSRPNNKRTDAAQNRTDETVTPEPGEEDDDPDFAGAGAQHRLADDDDTAPSEKTMRGLFSAESTDADAPRIATDALEPMLRAATRLVTSLRLGRSRKWRSMPRGSRFDFRRTLRQSLSTGGDALHPRWQGHPRRHPRIVVLLDGSRSMLETTAPALQFAYALTQRSRRVDIFTFSTDLHDVTRDLRSSSQLGTHLELPRTNAWGGGTRIGESLRVFLREHGARVLTPDTLVIVSSDGLDVGDTDTLMFAMRELRRRSAGIVWLNPLAAHPDFRPTARGMKAALPFVTALTHAQTPAEFAELATIL
ncbi:MAG: VWA domain-containing protein [Pleurocapsa sp. SU_196_0]|nr:VWA domain-containing protein [Pleurocapsa sp. SU_196_0]